MSGPASTPMMRPVVQPSSGTPATLVYTLSTSEITTPSYVPYESFPQNNSYFPFPSPLQPIAPAQGQPHVGVNFFQSSPIQQFQNFEQLNTKNSAHQSNNAKKKEKTETIIKQDQGEINPNRTNLLGETRIRGTRTPKGEIKKITKGGTTITSGRTSLVPFAVSMVIILTIAPKSPTLNG
jgi:hypothetical protein